MGEETEKSLKRRARNPITGKTEVTDNISYKEWAEKPGINKSAKMESLKKANTSGIIEEKVVSELTEMHIVGKIDIEKYKCVTEDIKTDEVIITDERIQHIKERHPNDYERFVGYIPNIISNPDYIIEANKSNTAVILKEFSENNEKFKLILRLKIENDPQAYKNSIISFWKIGDTTWNKNIKNKKILYKNE